MKNKIRNKKIEATAAIIAVVMTAVVVSSLPAIVADDTQDTKVYDGEVTITLAANDEYSDIANTYYAMDPNTSQIPPPLDVFSEYTIPFTESEPGTHTVWYYSVDTAGNVEEPKSTTFIIFKDIIPPVTNCTLDGKLHIEPTP